MPPRHGKSELISRWFPLWVLENWPETPIALASYGASLAEKHGGAVRNLIEANRAQLRVRLRRGGKKQGDWETTTGGGMKSVGVGGGLTGTGYRIGIIDDPLKDRKAANSAVTRQDLKDWYTSTFYTRQAPNASIVILMTRWHEDDLVGWLLEEAKNGGEQWDVLCLPALAEEGDSLGRAVGEALCPWRYPADVLRQVQRAVGPRDWAALFQQRPSAEAGDIFQREWFARHWQQLPAFPEMWLQSWDMAFKGTDGSDYVAGQVWCQKAADRFLVDQVRGRMSFTATLDAVRSLTSKYPQCGSKLVEDKANGPAVISTLQQEIPGLVPVDPQGGKEVRAWACTGYYEAGNVLHPSLLEAPWFHDYREEFVAFPNGRNDDQVDATTQALIYMQQHGGMLIGGSVGELTNWAQLR